MREEEDGRRLSIPLPLTLPAEIKPTPDQTGSCRIDRDFGNHQR